MRELRINAADTAEQARLQLLLAEFTWVAGLVRYYREVELKALAGAGAVLVAVAAAFTALEESRAKATEAEGTAAEITRRAAEDAELLVLAAASAVTAFLLPIVLMAQMRQIRAAAYIREWLHPRAL